MRLSSLDGIAVVGLGLGAVFGPLGAIVSETHLRQTFWALDGAGLVVATALLAIRFLRMGSDCVAAGYFVFAVAEGLILSGAAAGLEASVPSFAAGILLWAAALLMVSLPRQFAFWVRLSGTLAAVLFIITAGQLFLGAQLLPTSAPLPFLAYPVLVLTLLGWIWELAMRQPAQDGGSVTAEWRSSRTTTRVK